jgi:ATP-dependent exoDNAse (exonuclease V) beta subunit
MSFKIYRSSAGSGKTRTLAKEYIRLALGGTPESFRHILAVTFANKATQEMKERIVEYLADFSYGRTNNLTTELQTELQLSDQQLQKRSREVLSLILHRYSQFSISTIDSFFQRVIRSFTREAGLLGNFRLEVDNDLVLDEVISALMDELGQENKELTQWVVQFSRESLDEGDSWNITEKLKGFARQVFNDEFKEIESEIIGSTNEDYQRVLRLLRQEIARFENFMKGKAREALTLLEEEGITADDFNYKDRGTPIKYFREFSKGKHALHDGPLMQAALANAANWPSKKSLNREKLQTLAGQKLLPLLKEMVRYDEKNLPTYRTAEVIYKNFYAFGLVADITRKLQTYKRDHNVMLLSDAPQFLNGVINNSDTPFIYEKVGSWFQHYLIDEFQDTSRFQWKNFVPLLKEASDQSYQNLIVGDVKQSIYRWRGGDLQLLQSEITHQFGQKQVNHIPLNTNYRSAGNIVRFNNMFFQTAAPLLAATVNESLPTEVYQDVEQKLSKWPDQGYVNIQFLEKDDESFEDQALGLLPGWLEKLRQQKVALKDIAILVRKNEEGQRIANYLLQYQHSPQAKPGFKYEVVSNESLRLDTSWSVNVLISAFLYLKNPQDNIARAQLTYELATNKKAKDIFAKAQRHELSEFIPEEFILQARYLTKLSLFELTEELIRMFHLGARPEEMAYLQAFQDLILEFSAKEKTDLASFLEWWEIYKSKKSIQVSGSINAVTILTVHKSKGLQFKYVLIPFCHWKMNHERSPLLWVKSTDPPFSTIGPVAVRYSSKLENTVFAQAYASEYTKAHLDNLNLLYVAFTRAERGLIAMAPQPGKADKLATTTDVIYQTLIRQPELATHFNNLQFESGRMLEENSPPAITSMEAIELPRYMSNDWRTKLVIKRNGREFFDEQISEKRIKINTGILLHQAMAHILYRTNWKSAMDAFIQQNPLPAEVVGGLTESVKSVVEHPFMKSWFGAEWKIKTEAPVLVPGGAVKRIDRVMMGKSTTILVDYKTGERKSTDRQQVEQYAGILTSMGYPHVQAYLVYLPTLEVEEVVRGSSLTLF